VNEKSGMSSKEVPDIDLASKNVLSSRLRKNERSGTTLKASVFRTSTLEEERRWESGGKKPVHLTVRTGKYRRIGDQRGWTKKIST